MRRLLLLLLLTPVPAMAANATATLYNGFGFRLLHAVQKPAPRANVIVSPLSAALNLSMVVNGATDQTQREILTAMGFETSDINSANAELTELIRTPTNGVTLSVANSLWVDSRRTTLRPDYVSRVQASYAAELTDLDFANPNAPARINAWAAKQTHGRVDNVISRIDATELALLLNAVYFKGTWTHEFDKAQTRPGEFKLDSGAIQQVALMRQAARFDYFETPELQAVRLGFGDGAWVMEVFLPSDSSNLARLISRLSVEQWQSWQGQFASRPGILELPRFELKSSYRLNEPLRALGVRRAFAPDAQLSAMLTPAPGQPRRFFISSVLQAVYWKVDEAGSEAAAVTTTQIRAAAVARPSQQFHMRVDRPFFCAIQNQRSGALLFVGSIHDPTR